MRRLDARFPYAAGMPRERPIDPPARREPGAGRVEGLRFERPTPTRGRGPEPPGRRPRWPLAAVAAAGALLVVVVAFRDPLADRLWPRTRAEALRERAGAALAQGRLTAADGSGARELYEAALAMDPDRTEARDGLARTGQAALEQARGATAAGNYPAAHAALRLAHALSVPRAQEDAVAAALRAREADSAGIDRLLARARQARSEHRLDGDPDAALPLYQRVLSLQPDRVAALEGREDAIADLLQLARRALASGDLAAGAAMVAAARGYDPGHADLPPAEDALVRSLEAARQAADTAREAGDLARAEAGYRTLQSIDPDDAGARSGLAAVGAAWARRAERDAADFRFADADAALARARRLAPEAADAAAPRIDHARRAQASLGSPLPAAERARRVAVLLAGAAAAQARGDLLVPPGDSAFDQLRAARALAPADPRVREAVARLRGPLRDCFERSLDGNDLGRASACLDAWEVLDGNDQALAQARRRLALRWLAYGDERLGAGELERARAALAAARSLDPATPGLARFAMRVRAAGAGRR